MTHSVLVLTGWVFGLRPNIPSFVQKVDDQGTCTNSCWSFSSFIAHALKEI
jgi:hypothetical protein